MSCLLSRLMEKRTIHLCIGGNLGEREANLEEARMFIEFNFGDIVSVSPIYESDAWQMENAPPFLNQIVIISSELSNKELLEEIAELDEFYERERGKEGYQSREMDIDVLFIDEEIIDTPEFTVPHPRLHLRKFVLAPLNDLSPELMHPVLKKSVATLLKECEDTNAIKKL